jgi:hypothetical protein
VHDDHFDLRPIPDHFAREIAARAAVTEATAGEPPLWLRGWHDREGIWTNLRNIEHWIERAGA